MAPETFRLIWTSVLYTGLGVLACISIAISTTLLTPIYVLRWLVKLAAPMFISRGGKAVTAQGHFLASEFIPISRNPIVLPPPRCTIITNVFVAGCLTAQELSEVIQSRWLTVHPSDGLLKYPEFQQYIEKWMGFMFWRDDPTFSLSNHLFTNSLPDSSSVQDCDKLLTGLIETLLNTPFTYGRSPWEIHLLQNFKTSSCSPVTVCLCRFHHAMVDGFSLMNAVIEGLVNVKLDSVGLPIPSQVTPRRESTLEKLVRLGVYTPWRTIHDMGYFLKLNLQYRWAASTPWHASDHDKTWKHVYSRLDPIPISKIKYIKNKLGVSFTSILLSCLGATAAETFKLKGYKGREWIPICTLVPLPNHPDKLRNHLGGTFLELPTSSNMSSLERLHMTETQFQEARHRSQIPLLSVLIGRLFSAPVARLAKVLCTNRIIPATVSNFPGPGVELEFLNKKILGLDFTSGGLFGVNGISFSVISYAHQLRIAVAAENCVAERPELDAILQRFQLELESLYHLAQGKTDIV